MRRAHGILRAAAPLLAAALLAGCAGLSRDREHDMIVSVPDQQLLLLKRGQPIARYPVSTSKFGLGDRPGSYATPLGRMRVARKIGDGAPPGTVFKDRRPTGEILAVDAPGRDPIVTRILWLEGAERRTANAFRRYIYIHGTPEERNIGRAVSYGCVRMRSRDVIELYNIVGPGADVIVTRRPLEAYLGARGGA